MIHYAVEHTLKARGFRGRVKAGADSSASDIIELYRVTCNARDCPPLPVDGTSTDAVRAAIAELTRRWDAIPVGGSLALAL